ncbi:MAG TPA: hypothetical protein VIC34_00275 [Croceibacterium sp.]
MRLILTALISLDLVYVTPAVSSDSVQSDRARVSAIVDRLGNSSNPFHEYEALDRYRCIALPLLASALAQSPTVRPGKVGGALGRPESYEISRTAELLQALRALTGHDEYGPISQREYRALPFYREVPGGDGILKRDSLIAGLPHGQSRYYGYWMSRGTYFYAPEGTQRAIKAQWRRFVATFDCRAKLLKRRWVADFIMGQTS